MDMKVTCYQDSPEMNSIWSQNQPLELNSQQEVSQSIVKQSKHKFGILQDKKDTELLPARKFQKIIFYKKKQKF